MMTEAMTVTAVYKDGLLRPLQPLDLQENSRVRIQIAPDEASGSPDEASGSPDETESEEEAAVRKLVEAGLLTPPQGRSDAPKMSEEERQALADRLGQASGKPLSEIILEDRGVL